MCDFHSILGVAIGDKYEIRHEPGNSHSETADKLRNLPNRKAVIFEAEWNGEGELPSDSKLIRNIGECPDRLVKKIRDHYIKLKEALATGKHLSDYFSDTKKYSDVWNKAIAIANGVPVVLPKVFHGNLYVDGSAKLDALTEVGGDLSVYGELNAPKLQRK